MIVNIVFVGLDKVTDNIKLKLLWKRINYSFRYKFSSTIIDIIGSLQEFRIILISFCLTS